MIVDAQRSQRALEVFRVSGVPLSAQLTDTHSELPYRVLQRVIPSDRSVLHQRIAARFDAMLADGLLEERAGKIARIVDQSLSGYQTRTKRVVWGGVSAGQVSERVLTCAVALPR